MTSLAVSHCCLELAAYLESAVLLLALPALALACMLPMGAMQRDGLIFPAMTLCRLYAV